MSALTVAATSWPAAAAVALVLAAALAGALLTSVRVAGPQERIVVVRRGRARVAGPGAVLVLPGLDRARRVHVAPQCLGLVVARLTTADGVTVLALVTATFRVVDPARAADVDSGLWVERAVDAAVREEVARTPLAALAVPDPAAAQRVARAATQRLQPVGARVDAVTLDEVELSVGADLLRWAGRPAPGVTSGEG